MAMTILRKLDAYPENWIQFITTKMYLFHMKIAIKWYTAGLVLHGCGHEFQILQVCTVHPCKL